MSRSLVPALALGFPAVQARLDLQLRQNLQHQALLDQLHAHLDALASTHSLTTSLRTLRARQNAVALRARLTQLVARVGAGSVPAAGGPAAGAGSSGGLSSSRSGAGSGNSSSSTSASAAALRREEDELRVGLESLRPEVEAVRSRTGELWAGVGAVKASRGGVPAEGQGQLRRGGAAEGKGAGTTAAQEEVEAAAWAVADEDGLRKILEVCLCPSSLTLIAVH